MGKYQVCAAIWAMMSFAQCTTIGPATSPMSNPLPSVGKVQVTEELKSWIDKQATTRLSEEKSPGISLAVVIDGKLAYQQGYGVNTLGDETPPPLNTTYQIASVTKTFVGTLAAIMAVDGRIDLDAPVTDYLPELVFHKTAQNQPITLRLLLSHQSGLGEARNSEYSRPKGIPEGFDIRIYSPSYIEEFIPNIANTPNKSPVGERYSYSGTGMILAAHVLAKAGEYEGIEAALMAEILKPLGMKSTSVLSSDEDQPKMATPYAYTDNKYSKMCPLGTKEYYEIQPIIFGTTVGSSGLTSSTGDMALYLSAIMGEGDVITPKVKDVLFTPNKEFLYTDELVYQMGLGWRMGHFGSYGLVYQHTGYNLGHHASVLVSDEHDIGVIALTNGAYKANRRLAADVMLKLLQQSK